MIPFFGSFGAHDNRTIATNSAALKELKKGIIVTLFEGGNKLKDTPDNYRVITLSPAILKLLQNILLIQVINPPIYPL